MGIERGAWRSRTALTGFADRGLNRSSNAPFRVLSLITCGWLRASKILNAGAKVVLFFHSDKLFASFFALSLHISDFSRTFGVAFANYQQKRPCACGEIGRRDRLRIYCLTMCRFESCQAHSHGICHRDAAARSVIKVAFVTVITEGKNRTISTLSHHPDNQHVAKAGLLPSKSRSFTS